MKTLILMRHAHAAKAEEGEDDIDRPIDDRGAAEVEALGRWLRDQGHLPARTLISTARRARETFEGLGIEAECPKKATEELYNAMPSQIMSLLEDLDGDSAMVIAHNPGIDKLKRHLLRDAEVDDDALETEPGSVAVLDFEMDDWADIRSTPATLRAFATPSELI